MTYRCPNARMKLPVTRELSEPFYLAGTEKLVGTATCPACDQTVAVRFLDKRDGFIKGHYYTDHQVDAIEGVPA